MPAIAAWQSAFDPLLDAGCAQLLEVPRFHRLSRRAIDAIVAAVGDLPTPQCEIFIAQIGGASQGYRPEAMAYPHRDAEFVMNVHTRWGDPGG